MKTVVITGSARGFGYEMLKLFRENNYNVVVCDVNEEYVKEALNNLNKIKSNGKILSFVCDPIAFVGGMRMGGLYHNPSSGKCH